MKGIILAGGSGTRLYPLTLAVSKQMLPIYDKPMIYYPLGVLMLAGIREILIISTPRDLPRVSGAARRRQRFRRSTCPMPSRPQPNGLAEAFIIGRDFIGDGQCRDDPRRQYLLRRRACRSSAAAAAQRESGATVFAYHVEDPERYGVVAFDTASGTRSDDRGKAEQAQVELGGHRPLFLRQRRASTSPPTIKPSARGELEITASTMPISSAATCTCIRLGRGYAWLDTGTHDSLHDASSFVRTIEHRQGIKIICPEEIAFELG